MNDFALVALGLLFGTILAVLGCAAYAMFSAAKSQREDTAVAHKAIVDRLSQVSLSIDKLRAETSLALSRMDADRLHDTAITLQSAAKTLTGSVNSFQRLLFAQAGQAPAAPTLAGFPPSAPMDSAFSLVDEAEDDERMLTDRERWNNEEFGGPQRIPLQYQTRSQAMPSQQPPSPYNNFSPLAGLPAEEKTRRINEFFERRKSQTATDMLSKLAAEQSAAESPTLLPDFDEANSQTTAIDDLTDLMSPVPPSRGDLED